jgi:hypothetical protein
VDGTVGVVGVVGVVGTVGVVGVVGAVGFVTEGEPVEEPPPQAVNATDAIKMVKIKFNFMLMFLL